MDTILYNGTIHTMAKRTVSALAIHRGRIVLAGSDHDALALRTSETEVVDLKGRCVLPGFTDSHTHFLLTGMEHRSLDLRGVTSLDELIERGRAYAASRDFAPGEWIIGYGFDHNLFDPPVLPDRRAADAISTEHPVILDRICGHVGTANTLALKLAGLDENSTVPEGELDRDENGKLNGVVREVTLDNLKLNIPRMEQPLVELLLEETGRRSAAVGLTAVHSDDLCSQGATWDTLRAAFSALEARNALSVRLWQEWEAPRPEQLQELLDRGVRTGDGDDWLKLGNVKLIGDGSLGARTALLRSDYSDSPGQRGIRVYRQEELDEMVSLCHGAGLQVAFHAIGDGACESFVNAVERAMAHEPKALRHRVVHCQIGDKALYERMGSLGMGADVQPAFVLSDREIAYPRLGARVESCYAWKSLLQSGVVLGGGSDSPVESFAPLWGIHCAVNRCGGPGEEPWLPDQRLTVEQAVALYTTGPAWLAHDEASSGTLEAGKRADLVVLDRDIFTVPRDSIKDIEVLLTMVDGRVSYQRNPA